MPDPSSVHISTKDAVWLLYSIENGGKAIVGIPGFTFPLFFFFEEIENLNQIWNTNNIFLPESLNGGDWSVQLYAINDVITTINALREMLRYQMAFFRIFPDFVSVLMGIIVNSYQKKKIC